MLKLSEGGEAQLAEIARRHGVSGEAARQVLMALAASGGTQAQFNHPGLGGMGQWSRGGMIMVGDMFNNGLKARVAALCDDLAEALDDPALFVSGGKDQPGAAGRWPAELGAPGSSGSQNDMHYAVFPAQRRLAIERHGKITIYDTGDHRIGGVSQQQSGDQSQRFTSQSGPVRLEDLKIVSGGQDAVGDAPPPPRDAPNPDAPNPSEARQAVTDAGPVRRHDESARSGDGGEAVFTALERLSELCRKGIITEAEFAAKKAELLARI